MKILVLGASFTGEYLADHFPEHEVWFVSRRAAELRAAGRRVIDFAPEDSTSATAALANAPRFVAIMDTVPAIADERPGADAAAILDPPYLALVTALRQIDPALPFIHVSSTSVFATPDSAADGETPVALDETSATEPENDRGLRRLRLEQRVRALIPDACILRSTGIYGPGRSIAIQFRAGNFRRTGSGNQYVSRIHVHDLTRLFLAMALLKRADPGDARLRLVHGVDERPTANREVFLFLERELGVTVPGNWRDAPASGRIIRSLYAKNLLGGRYRYPTYVEGFRACLESESESDATGGL